LAGLPITWLRPGARLVVESLPTQFGPVTIRLEIAADGQRGVLSVLTPGSQQGVVRVDLRRLKAAGFGAYRDGALLPDDVIAPWNGLFELEFATRGE
jgi:hypothetical protein